MIGAVLYIGAAFAFVIMGDSKGAAVANESTAVTETKNDSKKADQTPKTETAPKGVKP